MSGHEPSHDSDVRLLHQEADFFRLIEGNPNTPGVLGYVRMILLAWLLLALGILAAVVAARGPVLEVATIVVPFTVILGTPVGVVGAVLVHLTCRHQSQQELHVLAAGVAGWLCTVVLLAVLSASATDVVAGAVVGAVVGIPVGVAAAIARAAVRP